MRKFVTYQEPSALVDDIIAFGRHDSLTISLYMRCCIDFQILDSQSPLKDVSSTGFTYLLGVVFLAKGVLPDPKKVKAIHSARPPKSVSEVRSFFGIITHCAKFIFSFSEATPFQWKDKHDLAFQKVKMLLASNTIIAYFDESELTTEAAPYGLSVILLQ